MSKDLENMLADYFEGGGEVKILPATEYDKIIGDELRLRNWGFTSTVEDQKINDSIRDQINVEAGRDSNDQ